MNDDGVQTDEQPQTRRGRKRTRRNYAKELERLQAKVDVAVMILGRLQVPGEIATVIGCVVDTLSGE